MPNSIRTSGDVFLVNTYTDNDQINPSIAANPFTGGFQVVWQSDGQDGDGWGAYAQNFDADGTAVGDEIQISNVSEGDQTNPDVAFNEDGHGSWVFETTTIWFNTVNIGDPVVSGGEADNVRTRSRTFGFENVDEDDNYFNDERVRYGRFDPEQEGQGGYDPRVISLGGDQFATGYYVEELFRNTTQYTIDEYTANIGRVIPRNGQWSRVFADTDPGSRPYTQFGDLAQLQDEDFILMVSTLSETITGTGSVIQFEFFEREATNGLAMDQDFRYRLLETSGLNGDVAHPRVAVLNDGSFAITWEERDQRAANEANWDWDVFVQVFNADGSVRSPRVAVHDDTVGDQLRPEIEATADGGFVIVYNDARTGNVIIQRFNADGQRTSEATVVNESGTTADDAAVTVLENGSVVVTWESEDADSGGMGIAARILDLTSTNAGAAQFIIGTLADETINAGARKDVVDGRDGEDRIDGGGGKDRLFGGNDNDRLIGGKGNDYLSGDDGNDILIGNGGKDKFVFTAGRDQINDFQNNIDRILFDRDLGSGDLTKRDLRRAAEQTDDGLLFDFGSDELLVLGVDSWGQIKDDVGFV